MGRLRNTLVAASETAYSAIESGEDFEKAVSEASEKYEENFDEIATKVREKRNKEKKEKISSFIRDKNNSELNMWHIYVGPIQIMNRPLNQYQEEIMAFMIVDKDFDDAKNLIIEYLALEQNTTAFIPKDDWEKYSENFGTKLDAENKLSIRTFDEYFPYLVLIASSLKEKVLMRHSDLYRKLPNKKTDSDIINTEVVIDEDIANQIKDFNEIENKRSKDYLNLSIKKDDPLNLIPKEKLQFKISEKYFNQIIQVFNNEEDIYECIKWVLRGLDISDAFKKVKIDNESKGIQV